MAQTLTSTVVVSLNAILANAVGLAAVQGVIQRELRTPMLSGVGATQADRIFSETAKSISGNYDVDLSGVLTDIFGAVISFARIKALIVIADPTNSGNVIVGGAATPFFGPFGGAAYTANVRPGGCLCFFAPDATAWPVVNAASDLLRFAPSAGTQLFDWAIVGASA